MTEEVEDVLKAAKRSRAGLIFDHSPTLLVERLLQLIEVRSRRLPDLTVEL
ncbi:hypothetical protein IPG36_07165 [bacterium]|nr:MAG: hypothetical protein IPG36_07165 [bacterium]